MQEDIYQHIFHIYFTYLNFSHGNFGDRRYLLNIYFIIWLCQIVLIFFIREIFFTETCNDVYKLRCQFVQYIVF